MAHARQMSLIDALQVIHDLRDQQVVISSMGTAREWPRLSQHPLDLHYVPSAMGQAPVLGLGIALAQPVREVIVFCGDGSLLMNLGCLVTIANAGAKNLKLILFDNGIYEVTGGQQTAAGKLESGARCGVDWPGMARSAGLRNVCEFAELEQWRDQAAEVLAAAGPSFTVLRVAPAAGDTSLESPGPMRYRLQQFCAALGVKAE